MKLFSIVLVSLILCACSEDAVEEFAFRKSLEYGLTEKCGEDDKECVNAVQTQLKGCMEKSNWRKFVASEDDPVETKRFTQEFYACIVDSEGNPYFESVLADEV